MVMVTKKDVTFVIPAFNLVDERLNNLKFILPFILATECKVILVEQTRETKSKIKDAVKQIVPKKYSKNFKHALYKHDASEIHKTGIINWATKELVKTSHVWVNDTDYYMKYSDAFYTHWNAKFIQPYETAKKLSKQDSETLLSGQQLDVSYVDFDSEYISLYGALSFIFEKQAFLEIGGMNEKLFGWAQEDVEFSNKLKESKVEIQKLELKGIHIWHPVKNVDIKEKPVQNKLSDIGEPNVVIPKKKDLAVITCYFNWCGFITPTRNFHRFLREMKNNKIPLYGIELSLTGKFETTGMHGWTQMKVKKENMCFQKEACLNLVEKKVPRQYTKLAWIDCDLIFMNSKWYTEASKKLDKHKLIQLYTHGYNTDRYGRIVTEFPSIMYMKDKVASDKWFTHSGYPGGAWAARREFWKHGGLYPYSVMGGGDTIFVYSLYDYEFNHPKYEKIGIQKNRCSKAYLDWKAKVNNYIKRDVSYIENKFIHEWHGDKKNRNYTNRHDVLKKIDIRKQVRLNEKGILEFYGIEDDVVFSEIHEYFLDRDEDGFFDDMREFGTMKYNKLK